VLQRNQSMPSSVTRSMTGGSLGITTDEITKGMCETKMSHTMEKKNKPLILEAFDAVHAKLGYPGVDARYPAATFKRGRRPFGVNNKTNRETKIKSKTNVVLLHGVWADASPMSCSASWARVWLKAGTSRRMTILLTPSRGGILS
jgi:hypothetical protein